MARRFEYQFVRIAENRVSALFGVQDKTRNAFEGVVKEYGQDGWRLVQIFAPGVAAFGAARYYELIFEREQPVAAEHFARARELRKTRLALLDPQT